MNDTIAGKSNGNVVHLFGQHTKGTSGGSFRIKLPSDRSNSNGCLLQQK